MMNNSSQDMREGHSFHLTGQLARATTTSEPDQSDLFSSIEIDQEAGSRLARNNSCERAIHHSIHWSAFLLLATF